MQGYAIYGKESCCFCDKAKDLLETNGIDYDYIDITNLETFEKQNLQEIAGQVFQTVPQVFQYTKTGLFYVGGYKELNIKIKGSL
jgi:glutaredoxin 1